MNDPQHGWIAPLLGLAGTLGAVWLKDYLEGSKTRKSGKVRKSTEAAARQGFGERWTELRLFGKALTTGGIGLVLGVLAASLYSLRGGQVLVVYFLMVVGSVWLATALPPSPRLLVDYQILLFVGWLGVMLGLSPVIGAMFWPPCAILGGVITGWRCWRRKRHALVSAREVEEHPHHSP